jgi:hypothetical protein
MGLFGSIGKGAAAGSIGGPWGSIIGGGLGLLGGLFGHKAKQKQEKEQRRAQIGAATLGQNMSEDKRLARLKLGQSILAGLHPGAAYGGRVNFNTAIDPAILAELSKRREYDFSQGIPDQTVGAGTGLLGGLFSGAGNLLGEADLQRRLRRQQQEPITSFTDPSAL